MNSLEISHACYLETDTTGILGKPRVVVRDYVYKRTVYIDDVDEAIEWLEKWREEHDQR